MSPFSGVIDSDFIQRIEDNYIEPPKASLFSHYIFSKIQRRLAGTNTVNTVNSAPYVLETSLALSKSDKNLLSEQTSREREFSVEEGKQSSSSELLFSEQPSRFFSVKPKEFGNTVRKEESEANISQKARSPENQSQQPVSVSSVTVSINDVSFVDTVAGKLNDVTPVSSELIHVQRKVKQSDEESAEAKRIGIQNVEIDKFSLPTIQETPNISTSTEPAIAKEIISQKLSTKQEEFSQSSPLTIRTSFASETNQIKPSGKQQSESYRIKESPSFLEQTGIFPKYVSSIPVGINDASFADTVVEIANPELSPKSSDVIPVSSELAYFQRQEGQIDENIKATIQETPLPNIQEEFSQSSPLTIRTSFATETNQVKPSGKQQSESYRIEKSPSFLEQTGIFRKPISSVPVGINDSSFANIVAEKSNDVISVSSELTQIQRQREQPEFQSLTESNSFSEYTVLVSPSQQDKILTVQAKSTEDTSITEQTRKVPNWEAFSWKTDKIGVLRKSVLPSSIETFVHPVVMKSNTTEEEISEDMSSTHVSNIMRTFKRNLDMPHVRLHDDSVANFMASKLNAEAFTVSPDIFFASGKLNLSTPQGISLLGHELTHVKQQEENGRNLSTGEISASQQETLEAEALANEQTILSLLNTRSPQNDSSMMARNHILERSEGTEGFGNEPVDLTHLHSPQIQYAMPQRSSTPLTAEEGRSIETTTPAETPVPPTPEPTTPNIDINRIANEVYDIIERRLRDEKERRGYF